MGRSKAALVALALIAAPSAALAQAEAPKTDALAKPAAAPKTPKAKTEAQGKTVEGVTVTGTVAEVQTSIDRRSYTIGKDLQATSGSIADALRNLPSVDVDAQGALSLRGDPNVTVLVDGKPSPMFEGAGRADALQQLPADQIERVEVITNPSAALNPEGSGGVINLITKKSRGAGVTGSAYATAASAGLKRAGVNLGYNSPKLAVTGSLAGNYQHNKQHNTEDREALDPVSGRLQHSSDDGLGRNLARGPTARLSVTYTPQAKDQITGGATYNELLVQGHPFDRFENDGVDGAPVSILDRLGERRFLETDTSLTAGWKHTFGEGHELSLDAIYNASLDRDHRLFMSTQVLPAAFVPLDATRDDESDHHAEFRAAYSQGLAGGALKAGYELKHDDNDFDHIDAMGPTPDALAPVASLANHFLFHQTINAAYATYQHAFGDFDAQAGLRLETVRLEIAQLTSGQRNSQDYTKAYPTLHLAYKLDDERKITASYSTRVQRAPAFLLNPLLQVDSPAEVQVGNPDLRPQVTHSYELGYEQHRGQASYQATLYYRRNLDQVNQIERDLGNGVFEFSFGNLGGSQSAGLELTANGKFNSALSYNLSSNLFWSQIDAANLGAGAGAESGYGASGRANLNWQVRPDDMLQFNAIANGRRLVAQGELEPNFTVNLGWRHKVNDRITATVTVQDLLAGNRFRRRLDTAVLSEDLDIRPAFRSVFLRLDYRFGGGAGKPVRDPGFEYENSGPPPA